MNYIKSQEIIATIFEKLSKNIITHNMSYSIDEIYKEYKLSTAELVKNFLEYLDEYIFKNKDRKKRYESNGFVSRTIITQYGEVTFKRRYYLKKDETGEDGFLLDRYLNLEPYSKLTREAKIKVINSVADNISYRSAGLQAIDGVILSKQTVYNCIKDSSIDLKPPKTKISSPVIHISVDGFHLSESGQEKKPEKKFANIFTGIQKIGKKRNKLTNSFIITQKKGLSFIKSVKNALNCYFDMSINPKIYVGGDGASWIKTFAEELNATFVIDKFHFYKALSKNIDDNDIFFEIIKEINKGNYECIKDYKEYFQKENASTGEIEYNDDYKFLINNAKYTKNWLDENYIGTFAEKVVSHTFNIRMRAIPRVWGSNMNKVMFLLSNSNPENLDISFDDDLDYRYKGIDELFTPTIDLSTFRKENKSFLVPINQNCNFLMTKLFSSIN